LKLYRDDNEESGIDLSISNRQHSRTAFNAPGQSANKALHRTMNLPRFSRHQNLTKMGRDNAENNPSKEDSKV